MGDNRIVIAGKPEGTQLEVGKLYEVRHTRKGTFLVRVDKVHATACDATILRGVASAIMSYNVREEGEAITLGYALSYFIPRTEADLAAAQTDDKPRIGSTWRHKRTRREVRVSDVRQFTTNPEDVWVEYRYSNVASGRKTILQKVRVERFRSYFDEVK